MNIKEHLPLREMKTAAKIAGRSALAMALTMSMARIALADGGGFIVDDSNAPRQTVFVDDGRFPQCTNVKFPDRSILFEDPMTAPAPWTAVHPQLRYATELLYLNGLYDLTGRDILPQGTKFRFSASAQMENYCLPQQNAGWSRFIIETNPGVGMGLPSGGKDDALVEIELPEGINPVVLTRFAPRYQGGTPEEQKWLLLMAGLNQTITARNTDGSFSTAWKGPLLIPIYESREYGSSIKFVLPKRGFADDKPIPQPAMSTRDYPQCGDTVGLESKDRTHTYIVREFTSPYTQAKSYQVLEDKGNLGQCAVDFSDIPDLLKKYWMKQKGIDPDFPDHLDTNGDGVINSFDYSKLREIATQNN